MSVMLPYGGWGDTARRIRQYPEHIASDCISTI